MEVVALTIALVALAVSIGSAWLTHLHRGKVCMTQPLMVVFAYDPPGLGGHWLPKVMVRCLLFSTGESGRVIETLFVKVRWGSSEHVFPMWAINDDTKFVRAGGLLVCKTGVAAWHTFVVSDHSPAFNFAEGEYDLDLFACIHGKRRPVKLWNQALVVPQPSELADFPAEDFRQVWFDRRVESDGYEARWESAPAVLP